jgi:hypothetical protein
MQLYAMQCHEWKYMSKFNVLCFRNFPNFLIWWMQFSSLIWNIEFEKMGVALLLLGFHVQDKVEGEAVR